MKLKSLFLLPIALLLGCNSQLPNTSTSQLTYTPYPTYTPFPTLTLTPSLFQSNSEYAIQNNYPRLDGSTSTEPLQWMIMCSIYEINCSWVSSTFGTREIQVSISSYSNGKSHEQLIDKDLLPQIDHSSTHEAYVKLINGDVDFILEARLPSKDEIALAQSKGIKLETNPIALDALVFLVNNDNPVDSLTLQQIKDIYSGKIINWIELGGINSPITAYQREENSGSQELMLSLVMGETSMINGPEMMVVLGMMGPVNALEGVSHSPFGDNGNKDGIAYSVYYYMQYIVGFNQNIKILAVDGIRPTWLTIYNQTYSLTTNIYAVIRGEKDTNKPASLLLDWLLSKKSEKVIWNSGYIPMK
jgi:phosphate transport system substrate-binding protein